MHACCKGDSTHFTMGFDLQGDIGHRFICLQQEVLYTFIRGNTSTYI